jgi:hypothetical protein
MSKLRSAGNGLGDIYQIDLNVLNIEKCIPGGHCVGSFVFDSTAGARAAEIF